MKSYILVFGEDTSALEQNVIKLLNFGYVLIGGPFYENHKKRGYYQAVYFEGGDEEIES